MESRELAIQAAIALDKKKAANIKVIKVRDLTVLTDYFVIANGTSTTHVAALADEVEFQLVIVNVFTPDPRDFYGLEHQWADGEEVDISAELLAAEQAAKAEMQ